MMELDGRPVGADEIGGVRAVRSMDGTRYDIEADLIRQLREAYLATPGEEL